MKKNIFVIATLTALFLASCTKKETKPESAAVDSTAVINSSSAQAATGTDEIIKSTMVDAKGKKLEASFNNNKETATVVFDGETIELKAQAAGSGIWYKNDHYELRGKGSENELSKDGKVIFKGIK
ncbi:MliC family protein [Chryseobacterium sp. KMC2]|uniref:MliC family protein n=1 Tax=Chryseobacterium sp. KMC2 TaxID=2800705 RepID=UPI001924ABCF|nr:MliC family protein [Chryseobacterium sp. KMC2]MBL3547362.1 MliC family protein [Chryseobacterium sp. KMC2]